MREIKFRGKSEVTGEWVVGTYIDGYIIRGVVEANSEYISIENWEPVYSNSVAQYTGLKDVNGIDIYEGDILEADASGTMLGDTFYDGFAGYDRIKVVADIRKISFWKYVNKLKVIGNFYDNPELSSE